MNLEFKDGSWVSVDGERVGGFPVLQMPPGKTPSRTVCVWCGAEFYTETWAQSCEVMRHHQQLCADNVPLVRARSEVAHLKNEIDEMRAAKRKKAK